MGFKLFQPIDVIGNKLVISSPIPYFLNLLWISLDVVDDDVILLVNLSLSSDSYTLS